MSTATITLKVSAAEKKRLQAHARRAKKSLNAYVLGKVAGADVSRAGRLDYGKLTAHMDGRFADEEVWRMIPGRE
jgi:hypothetical protein